MGLGQNGPGTKGLTPSPQMAHTMFRTVSGTAVRVGGGLGGEKEKGWVGGGLLRQLWFTNSLFGKGPFSRMNFQNLS